MKRLSEILLIGYWFCSFYLYGQIKIQGRVLDEKNQALPLAKVWLHELNQGILTDSSGFFEMIIQKKGNYHLHFTYIGYKSQILEFNLKKDTSLTIQLYPSNLELKDIVIESNVQKILIQESSQDLAVITQDFIIKRNFDNLLKSIDRMPGIKTINIGVGASKPVIRGLSFNRVAVIENGIKQEGQQWGGDHGLELDGFNADEIEILKGPAALFYGSEAMGGVLHIQLKPPAQEGLAMQTLQGFRSNNQSFFQTTYASYKKNAFSFQVRHTYQNFGDYGVPSDSFVYNSYVLPIENQRLKNTGGREWNQMFRIGYHGNIGSNFITFSHFYQKLGFFSGAFGIPTAYIVKQDDNFRNISLPYQTIQHLKIQSNHKILVGKDWLEADVAWQQNIRKEFSMAHSHGQNTTDSLALGLLLNTFSANFRYFKKWSSWKWVVGGSTQYQKNIISGFEYLIPNFERFQWGIFQFLQYKRNENGIINAGIRVDYGKDDLQDAWVDFYRKGVYVGKQLRSPMINRTYWNYSFSSGISWFLTEYWNIKWNLGTDFRYPVPSELASNGIHHGTFRHEMGNPNLLPEKGYQSDIIIHLEKSKWECKISQFFSYFNNYIYLSPTARFSTLPEGGQIYQYLQHDAILWGGEFFLDYHWMNNLHTSVSADVVWGKNLVQYRPLPFMPPPSLLTHLEYTLKGLKKYPTEIWVEHRYTFSQNRVVINELSTPAFHLWNVGIHSKSIKDKQSLLVGFQVQNVFNTRYFYHLSKYRLLNIHEPARNFVIQLQWKWN